MSKRLSALSLAFFLAASPAFAQTSDIKVVVQVGPQVQPVNVGQGSDTNMVGVVQIGANPTANIWQNGQFNAAAVGQAGLMTSASISQFGAFNSAIAVQAGGLNFLSFTQNAP